MVGVRPHLAEMGSGFVPNAHSARERSLASATDEKAPAAVVRTAGAGSRASDGAAYMAARTFYPRQPRKSNKTSGGIHVKFGKGYKKEYKACRFLGRSKPRHSCCPATLSVGGECGSRTRLAAEPGPSAP